MKSMAQILPALGLLVFVLAVPMPAWANDLAIEIAPVTSNPATPQMGDHLGFETKITNTGSTTINGLITWLSLVRVDKGKEHPVSLEDWSAEKAVTAASLAPGKSIKTEWPMRLIQDGNYRVVVSAASRFGTQLAASPFADFSVRPKPVVESRRVLPVALGVPLLILGFAYFRRR